MSETSGGHIVGRQGIHPEEHGVLRLLQLVQEGLVGVLWEKAVSQQATLYPMARSLFAVASPKPEAAPVTMAILHRGCMTISGLEERK